VLVLVGFWALAWWQELLLFTNTTAKQQETQRERGVAVAFTLILLLNSSRYALLGHRQ